MVQRAKDALRAYREQHPEVQEEYDRLGPRFAIIDALIEARNRAGLSQRELAKRLGVSQSVLARFESAENSPRIDTIARIAEALDCDIEVRLKRRRKVA